jgi:hypothetical protein
MEAPTGIIAKNKYNPTYSIHKIKKYQFKEHKNLPNHHRSSIFNSSPNPNQGINSLETGLKVNK